MKFRNILTPTLAVLISLLFTKLPVTAMTSPQDPTAPTAPLGIIVGIQQVPTEQYGTELNQVNNLTQKTNGVVLFFGNWQHPFSFYAFLIDQINKQMTTAERPVVMFAWEPTAGLKSLGCDKDYARAIPITDITTGKCDSYIRQFATSMKARPERILLKFAHEMNNLPQPWSPPNFGLPPSAYVDMWHHVYDIFKSVGVPNVEWVWSPNFQSYPDTFENRIAAYYPGDAYVDWVGVNAYNYYDKLPGAQTNWASFESMVDANLKAFACQYRKPQVIHEMGSVEGPGGAQTKANWIADAYSKMPNYPFLRLAVWLNTRDNFVPSADFRVTSNTTDDGSVSSLPPGTSAWTTAYKNAIAPATFTSALPTLAEATPPTTYCGTGTPTPTLTVSPASIFLKPGASSTLDLNTLFFSDSPLITIVAPTGITVVPSPRSAPSLWGTVKLTLRTTTGLANGIYTVKITVDSATQSFTVFAGDLQSVYMPVLVK